jgi:hypothetical protein
MEVNYKILRPYEGCETIQNEVLFLQMCINIKEDSIWNLIIHSLLFLKYGGLKFVLLLHFMFISCPVADHALLM